MRKIAISILLLAYVSCTLANSFVKRSFRKVCALSRDQLTEFAHCLDDSLSDDNRDHVYGFLECLGFSSIFDYLENSCTSPDLDFTEDKVNTIFSCYGQYEEHLNNINKEDEKQCMEKTTSGIVE
ncbi:uncharacterized protein LOC111628317 [Centruroides sculpturatus]|uniref:uncharacterized protein LOC111628317 n=1 Tax=Centruroides sculpturatus TaxID=218467 RepID=UPI000C6D9E4B|nr:uncharacterized protein LOC111628317 [Centruroides sculpturatus]